MSVSMNYLRWLTSVKYGVFVKPLRIRPFAGALEQYAIIDKPEAELIVEFAFSERTDVTPEKCKIYWRSST